MLITSRCKRFASPVVALVALVPALAAAQEWQIISGAGSRAEYTDNYFYVAPSSADPFAVGPESAFTLSVIPFVAAVRRTEASEVKALVSIGANKAWGVSEEYLSARAVLDGQLRDERSTWTGSLSYNRARVLQNVLRGQDVVLAPTYTDRIELDGSYNYRWTDQWSVVGTIGGSYDRYRSVQEVAPVTEDVNFTAAGTARYAVGDNTNADFSLSFVHSTADLTRSDIVTARIGIVHRFLPTLAASASAGWYWSDARNRGGALVTIEEVGREDGGLFDGSLEYKLSEATRLVANVSRGLASNGAGTVSRSDLVALGLAHRFSDVLSGRIGATYNRTTFAGSLDERYSDKTLEAEVGLSWRLSERWILDAGYRYSRTRYSMETGEPKSNVVFVSLAYNWPGASLTGWIGDATGSRNLTGAGSLTLRDFATPGLGAATTAPTAPTAPEPRPFEPFTLP